MKVRIAFIGRGYDAAALPPALELPAGTTSDAAMAEINRLLPPGRSISPACLLAVRGQHLGTAARHAAVELKEGDELLLIAPVAGGG
jgi:hypothetical protein